MNSNEKCGTNYYYISNGKYYCYASNETCKNYECTELTNTTVEGNVTHTNCTAYSSDYIYYTETDSGKACSKQCTLFTLAEPEDEKLQQCYSECPEETFFYNKTGKVNEIETFQLLCVKACPDGYSVVDGVCTTSI